MGTFFQIVNLFCSSQYSTSKHLHSLDLSRDRGSTYTSLDRPGLYTGYIIVLSLRSVSISSQLGSYPIVVFVVLFVVLRWLLGLSPQHLQQYHPLCIVLVLDSGSTGQVHILFHSVMCGYSKCIYTSRDARTGEW